MSDYAVYVEGLDDLNDILALSEKVKTAALQAVNKTAERTRAASANQMRRELNFPGNYLDPSQGRLYISARARKDKLEAVIMARGRATSLGRFVVESGGKGRQGVVVELKRGVRSRFKRGFMVNLNGGQSKGLAYRTKDGQKPDASFKPVKLAPNLWLLYGLSVDQAFRKVSKDQTDEALLFLANEFDRLTELQK